MRLPITYILIFGCLRTFSQNAFRMEYLVSSKNGTDLQTLQVLCKDGNTLSEITKAGDSVAWNRDLRLKAKPKSIYQLIGTTYIELPNDQSKK